ncbi:Panacea domain-containing protein [Bacillus cereus group sp. MYBK65-1]|uniref:Panacea domain-containing protein n=1 Tax=unclassified Bacillus cereus group TaxID=2750818 RepID=UPI002A4F21DA|nr:DUF4065 domain-containing protein [Bacillus cereus]
MPNVYDVASYFLSKSKPNTPWAITPLKLQKLVYYAQGWHLALRDKSLFKEDLEAWLHGPVVPDLYQEYKHFGYLTIKPEIFTNTNKDGKKIFSNKQLEVLDSVWETYGQYDGKFLEELTHQEDPWLNTTRNQIIPNHVIKTYFKKLINA